MPGAGELDPESRDGSNAPSTPPPNPRASSTSLPKIAVSPEEELQALAEYCRASGGIVVLFDLVRKRSRGAIEGLQSTNLRLGELEVLVGTEPTNLKVGSGALKMLAEIKQTLTVIVNDMKKDREEREKAEKDRETAKEAAERSPTTRIKWIAISAFVGAVVVAGVGCTSAYLATHWSANPSATSAPASAPAAH